MRLVFLFTIMGIQRPDGVYTVWQDRGGPVMNAPNPYVFNGDPALSQKVAVDAAFATLNIVQKFWMSAVWGLCVHDTIKILKFNPFLAPFLPDVPMYIDETKIAGSD